MSITLQKKILKGASPKQAIAELQRKMESEAKSVTPVKHTITTAYPSTAPYVVGSNGEDVLLIDPVSILGGEPDIETDKDAGVYLVLPDGTDTTKPVRIEQLSGTVPLVCITRPTDTGFTGMEFCNPVPITYEGEELDASVGFWLSGRGAYATMEWLTESGRWSQMTEYIGARRTERLGFFNIGTEQGTEAEKRMNYTRATLTKDEYKELVKLHQAEPLANSVATTVEGLVSDFNELLSELRTAGLLKTA